MKKEREETVGHLCPKPILSERHLPVDRDTDEALKVRTVETIPAGPGELMSPSPIQRGVIHYFL